MENKKNVEVKEVKVSKIKLNVNFIDFIEKILKDKLMVKSRDELRKMYKDSVKVKSYNNINRVSERVKRDKLRNVLNKVLKEKGIEFNIFDKVSNELVSKIRDRKVSNYIEL